MKRLYTLLFAVALVGALLAGCQNAAPVDEPATPPAEEAAWTITVEGVGDDAIEFTSLDAEEIETVDISAVLKKKDGSEIEQSYKGLLLSDVLEYVGAEGFSSVEVAAADGYAKELDLETVNDEGTIVALEEDGNPLINEKGWVLKLVVKSKPGNYWIKNVAKVIVK